MTENSVDALVEALAGNPELYLWWRGNDLGGEQIPTFDLIPAIRAEDESPMARGEPSRWRLDGDKIWQLRPGATKERLFAQHLPRN